MPESRSARAFQTDAVRWCRIASEDALSRVIRSPYSGVPHDVAAAYATLASRTGSLMEAIERERLALPAPDRDAVFAFAERARKLFAAAPDLTDDALVGVISSSFSLPRSFALRLRASHSAQDDKVSSASKPLVLAEPVEREVPSGVRARSQHFSASALNAYAECERKWYYRYVCAAVEDKGSSAATYGTAFHLALEDFHAVYPRPRAEDEREMREAIVADVKWAFERNRDGFDTAIEFELQLRRAQRTAQRYVDWLLAQERRAPFEVIGREVPANIELGGHAFVGFIDRLDRDERTGSVAVVDYKTGNIAASAAEYREKIRTFRDFQLPFYYWARTEAGDRVSRLALLPLKDALLDVRPVELEVTIGRDDAKNRKDAATGTISVADLERARARMIEVCDRLTSGEIERFPVTTDPGACVYCAYALACAGKPAPAEEKFGR
jgi:CRISPR/Cas system-associated exonuclease Cas4 (RecB family)